MGEMPENILLRSSKGKDVYSSYFVNIIIISSVKNGDQVRDKRPPNQKKSKIIPVNILCNLTHQKPEDLTKNVGTNQYIQ